MSHESITEDYDLVILGSGEGSKFLAWTLARQGQRVAAIEQRWIGGSCPNIACLPSKNIIHSARSLRTLREPMSSESKLQTTASTWPR